MVIHHDRRGRPDKVAVAREAAPPVAPDDHHMFDRRDVAQLLYDLIDVLLEGHPASGSSPLDIDTVLIGAG